MNLYLLKQDVNKGYDTYDSAVVAAESIHDAKTIHPRKYKEIVDKSGSIVFGIDHKYYTVPYFGWTTPNNIQASTIGIAGSHIKRGVICASFKAG